MDKFAVTGAEGMIGRHMVSLLESEGIKTVPLTRVEWDLTHWKEFEEFDSIFDGVTAIFHFGAKLPAGNAVLNRETQTLFDANVRSCLNLSEWATSRNIALIFLSGATVYADPCKFDIREDDPKVVNGFGGFYGYTKLLAEQIIQHYVHCGLRAVVLRPSSVYGYGLGENKLIQVYLNLATSNQTIKIDQPNNKINLIHALDIARAALQAYRAGAFGIFNIAHEKSPSVLELANAVVDVCKKGTVDINNSAIAGNPFIRFHLSTRKAVEAFSFTPSVTLREGLLLMKSKRIL